MGRRGMRRKSDVAGGRCGRRRGRRREDAFSDKRQRCPGVLAMHSHPTCKTTSQCGTKTNPNLVTEPDAEPHLGYQPKHSILSVETSQDAESDQEDLRASSQSDPDGDANENSPECIQAAFNIVGEYVNG
ncbi:hypothetical protein P154DRAFT_617827 [Amniculicola lignicola CBS 123094]|uniref:Uncharacterized protein n=1 Tax=Amniculicola lignicola CBS 123094 TaxID=1392246 RepID=A0A6A5WQI9_9PLEO|nr:hypothetical protein P154DRAFT_617827 [Amniculicola lignicola CBS 123094]